MAGDQGPHRRRSCRHAYERCYYACPLDCIGQTLMNYDRDEEGACGYAPHDHQTQDNLPAHNT